MENGIDIKGLKNARDLSYLKTSDNRAIKKHILIRSNALNRITKEDLDRLKNEFNLKKVIDLRTPEMILKRPNQFTNEYEYTNIQIYEERILGIKVELKESDPKAYLLSMPDMPNLYRMFVLDGSIRENFSKVLKLIINNRDGSILWHCSQGKDRCGMVSVLVLNLLGVKEEDIIEDYLYTNKNFIEDANIIYNQFLEKTNDPELSKRIYRINIADIKYYNAFKEEVLKKANSFEEYIINCLHISKEEIDDFRKYALDE